ncbi:MAG: 50S ribosomal protein L15 [Verrucomicrobiae bacterium]|nr:50S ribosomal protein L15 [Verrucomicrobiae bacterium]
MRLHNLKPREGSRHRRKRRGCGESSGHGKTSGRGHKGQKARSGGSIRPGFEGGQMPLVRRLPKRGFSNARFRTRYAPVNVGALNDYEDGAEVNEASLRERGIVNGRWDGVKLLGDGDLKRRLTVRVDAASAQAREKIEKAGGTVETPAPTPTEGGAPAPAGD